MQLHLHKSPYCNVMETCITLKYLYLKVTLLLSMPSTRGQDEIARQVGCGPLTLGSVRVHSVWLAFQICSICNGCSTFYKTCWNHRPTKYRILKKTLKYNNKMYILKAEQNVATSLKWRILEPKLFSSVQNKYWGKSAL